MLPPHWTTPEQTAFLESRKPDFIAAQNNNNSTCFFPKLFKDWFERWPEQDTPSPNNHSGSQSLTDGSVNSSGDSTLTSSSTDSVNNSGDSTLTSLSADSVNNSGKPTLTSASAILQNTRDLAYCIDKRRNVSDV